MKRSTRKAGLALKFFEGDKGGLQDWVYSWLRHPETNRKGSNSKNEKMEGLGGEEATISDKSATTEGIVSIHFPRGWQSLKGKKSLKGGCDNREIFRRADRSSRTQE